MKYVLLVMLFSSVAGARSLHPDTYKPFKSKEYKVLSTVIESVKDLAAADLSCERDADCTALAYGKRACGGPAGAVVASKLNGAFDLLEMAAAESTRLGAEFNRKYRIVSICSLVMIPRAVCESNVCVAE